MTIFVLNFGPIIKKMAKKSTRNVKSAYLCTAKTKRMLSIAQI